MEACKIGYNLDYYYVTILKVSVSRLSLGLVIFLWASSFRELTSRL